MKKLEIKTAEEDLICYMVGKTLVSEHEFRYNGVFVNAYSSDDYPIYFCDDLYLTNLGTTLEQLREDYYKHAKGKGFVEYNISKNQFIVFLKEKDARIFRYFLQTESLKQEEDWKYSVLPKEARDHNNYKQYFHFIECIVPEGSRCIQIDNKLIYPDHIKFKCIHSRNYVVEDEEETLKQHIKRLLNLEKDKLREEFKKELEKE